MGLLLVLKRVLLLPFWTNFCCFFTTPPRSSGALLAGSLPLRYCSSRFASRTPFWVLPVPGVGDAEVARRVSGFGTKRFRLKRKKNQHTSLVIMCMLVHDVVCKRRRCNQHGDDGSPIFPRTGVG